MRIAFKKMHEFSAADGFVEIMQSVGDTIRYAANEPSVGLFFVQQHTKNAAPNLIKLKNKISDKSHEMTLHNEDLDDSMAIVKSMKDCGNPIVDEMIKDINNSLTLISTKQPKIGVISSTSSTFNARKTSSRGQSGWDRDNDGVMGNYMSSMMSSAREKVTNFKWSPFDSREWRQNKGEKVLPYTNSSEVDADELPVSSPSAVLEQEESSSSSSHKWIPLLEKSYGDFRADREAKLTEWLEEEADEDGRTPGKW